MARDRSGRAGWHQPAWLNPQRGPQGLGSPFSSAGHVKRWKGRFRVTTGLRARGKKKAAVARRPLNLSSDVGVEVP